MVLLVHPQPPRRDGHPRTVDVLLGATGVIESPGCDKIKASTLLLCGWVVLSVVGHMECRMWVQLCMYPNTPLRHSRWSRARRLGLHHLCPICLVRISTPVTATFVVSSLVVLGSSFLFSHGFRHLLLRRRHLMLLIRWRVHNFVARTRLVEYLARSLVLAPLVISTSLSLKAMDIKMTGGVPTLLLLFLCRVRAGHGRITLNNSRRRRSTT